MWQEQGISLFVCLELQHVQENKTWLSRSFRQRRPLPHGNKVAVVRMVGF